MLKLQTPTIFGRKLVMHISLKCTGDKYRMQKKRKVPTMPTAPKMKYPEQSCFSSVRKERLGVSTNEPARLPGEKHPYYWMPEQ
jgi:hypothetical protein